MDKLSTKFWFSNAKKEISKEEIKAIRNRILETSVPIKAELGSATISVNDIINLQIGDVIKLDGEKDMLKLRIGSNVKFLGTPGAKNNKMAVKVVKVLKDGENSHD